MTRIILRHFFNFEFNRDYAEVRALFMSGLIQLLSSIFFAILAYHWPAVEGFDRATIKRHCPLTLSSARLNINSNIKNFLEML